MSAPDDALAEYLAVRRALGFKLEHVERFLRAFVRYLEERGEPRITITSAVAWATMPGGSDSLHYARLAAVRGFAAYLHGVDSTVEIPGSICCVTVRRAAGRSSTPTRRSSR